MTTNQTTNPITRIPLWEGATLRQMVEAELAPADRLGGVNDMLRQEADQPSGTVDTVLDWAAEVRALGYTWAESLFVAGVFYYG